MAFVNGVIKNQSDFPVKEHTVIRGSMVALGQVAEDIRFL